MKLVFHARRETKSSLAGTWRYGRFCFHGCTTRAGSPFLRVLGRQARMYDPDACVVFAVRPNASGVQS